MPLSLTTTCTTQEIAILESVEDSERQLAGLEHAQALALARHETSNLAGLWQSQHTELVHEVCV